MRNMRSQRGFTLIELVIVIAVIGLLSAIAIPQFQDLNGAAKAGATKAGLGTVRSTLAIRYANSATGGGVATFPTVLASSDFAAAEPPRNALSDEIGVTALTETTTGTATNGSVGFWFVSHAASDNWGKAGAYSDGTVDTSTY